MTTQDLPLKETIAPADEAAVAEQIRAARKDATPIYPVGGGTGLDYGLAPSRPGIGLSLGNLDGVIDYPAADMTITVEAGITVDALNGHLAAEGQRLPIDVRHPRKATIGGVAATNAAGPRQYAYGTIRDYVIGLRAVDGLGEAFSGGGRVVKNAAGYNLCRLMVGSLGTLGVITEVTLMVRPLTETSALVACDPPDFDTAERLLAGLVHTKTLPTAVELVAGPQRNDAPGLEPMSGSSPARLIVGFEASGPEVQWMIQQLQDEWREIGVAQTVTIADDQCGPMRDWLTEFPPQVQINVLPGATVETIGRLRRLDPGCSIQAHAGNGAIGVSFSPRSGEEFVALLREKLRPIVTSAAGRMVVASYPPDAELTRRDVWGPPGEASPVMQALKDRFDPQGILNAGRFVYENR